MAIKQSPSRSVERPRGLKPAARNRIVKAHKYVDGYVLPIPKKIAAYRRLARVAGQVWRKCGALEYRECVGEDLNITGVLSFLRMAKAKPGETVMFAWIVYKSRAHRDRVNQKVMTDPRMKWMMKEGSKLFDCQRMAYGGFRVVVNA